MMKIHPHSFSGLANRFSFFCVVNTNVSYERKNILASCLLLSRTIYFYICDCAIHLIASLMTKYSKRFIATKLDIKSYIMENIHTTQVDLHRGGGEVDLHRAVDLHRSGRAVDLHRGGGAVDLHRDGGFI